MSQRMLLVVLAIPVVWTFARAEAEVAPKESPIPEGLLVLDNCDSQYEGKEGYTDNLTLLNSTGGRQFRISGFNNCESIGSSRMIAADMKRQSIWVIENVARRIRRFDLDGKETLSIDGVHGSAIAIDPPTGNLWSLQGEGAIGKGRTVVYDPAGNVIKSYNIPGWDIAYDTKAKAFWIVDRKLTKIDAATGAVAFSRQITPWCASSVDVDPNNGAAWVGIREHPDVRGSSNALLKFDEAGKEVAGIPLGTKSPFRVSVDPKNGGVWVAHLRTSIERFSAEAKSEVEHSVAALAVMADPAGSDVWVVTATSVVKLTAKGELKKKIDHAGETSQAWIAGLE
jgi:DNA-binding beta-propeller fold protein YncE